MTHRATITLGDEAYTFLSQAGGKNKSAYINRLLMKEKRRSLEKSILEANREEAEDITYQEALSDWDSTLQDGLVD